jgi:molecular chaperone GrpE
LTDNSQKKKTITIESDDNPSINSEEQEPVEADDQPEINHNKETEKSIEDQLEAAKQEAAQERDRLYRLSAEFENYKKRMNRQMDEFRKYANEALLKDLLSVVDNLERALSTSGKDAGESIQGSLIEGVEMTLNEILKILTKFNVTPIESLEKPFDPVFHEAVMQEESDEQPENTVISEFQKGYLIHDRLLRPSMVVVSKTKS